MTAIEMVLKIAVKLSRLSVTPVEPALDALNEAVRYLALKLADRKSDLASAAFSKTTAIQTIALDATFNGFAGKPLVNNKHLEPVPIDMTAVPATGAQPLYYAVLGDTMYLYPTPTASVTVTGKCWTLPATLANSDTIPYGGRFDSLLLNMAVKLAASGYSVLSQQPFVIEVEQGLDAVLFPRKPELPSHRPQCNF